MIGSKFMLWAAALAIALGTICMAPAMAAEGEGGAESASPKSPIHVDVVDYADAGEGPGTLKLAGTALAGSAVYIFMDDKPLGKVIADGDGKWSVENTVELGDAVHQVRVEQYDDTTRMLAARAMFSLSRAKPNDGKGAAEGDAPAATQP
ncbi:MAG: hypothetical protein ACRECX_11135 [Methyloceanibacter sp.]|uniref:hypothetical protein n=1 Tax=Methyloceanibacter sp. TaxID=1965321 RepID=UPI003D6CF5D1